MDLDAGKTWIERDSNGRFVYVRKRTKLPSTRSLLAEAFGLSNNPFGRSRSNLRSRSLSRAESENYLRAQAPVRAPPPLALPAPPYSATTAPGVKMNPTPEGGHAVLHDTGQYSQPLLLNDPNQQLPYSQYPSYQPPYPAYYLAPNPPPPPPSFADTRPPYLPGARLLSPSRLPTPDELKYKCSICGKFRSPRFHYKHPIPPGQLPAQTVCRKCRQAGTDSEDSSDEKARLRGLRRGRSVVTISEPVTTRVISGGDGGLLRRRSSRLGLASRSRSRSRHRARLRRRSTSSSSLDIDQLDLLEDGRGRRPRSRSVGRTVQRESFIEEIPPIRASRARETFYIDEEQDLRRRRASRVTEDYYTDYDSEEEYVPRRRIISRAPSLARTGRRQYSEPLVREHVRVTTRDHLDGPNSVYEDSTVIEQPARPPFNLPSGVHVFRVSEDEAQRIKERLASSDEYELLADRPIREPRPRDEDWYKDGLARSRRQRRRGRGSRSRIPSRDELDSDYTEARHILPRVQAPSPPPADRRRSERHSTASRRAREDSEVRRPSRHEALDRHGRPVMVSRRTRSRSRSRNGSRWEAPFGGRPPAASSKTIDMPQRLQAPSATEDYDWYDSHGQRIRVREI